MDPAVQEAAERAYEEWWERQRALGQEPVTFQWPPRLRQTN
jgi:hypothetical protein